MSDGWADPPEPGVYTFTLHGQAYTVTIPSHLEAPRHTCPRCAGPSLSGGICLSCLRGPDPMRDDTPWAV